MSLHSGDELVGLTITQVRESLRNQGWYFLVRTPRLAQLEDGSQGLDLSLDPDSGEILDAALMDLN
ncbi:hypothetical protein C7271_16085 [filamentous cyanobacterium CCP5]|nr:hypothetical protein C7271_16085 [filamentous cyanobacterium CCP5]